jgi:hypothetical protein
MASDPPSTSRDAGLAESTDAESTDAELTDGGQLSAGEPRRAATASRPWRWARVPVWCLLAAYVLLVAAWVGGNPAMAVPDEAAHYLRAVDMGNGRLVGGTIDNYPPQPALTPASYRWVRQAVRRVEVPAGLSPVGVSCWVRDTTEPASCIDRVQPPERPTTSLSSVGTYQPLAYFAPAVALRAGDGPVSADLLGRTVSAMTALALVAFGLAAVWQPRARGLALLGPLVALTPMAIFVMSGLTPSGLEIASGFALGAGLLRLWRDGSVTPRWVWIGVAVSGAGLALSRSPGVAWVAFYGLAVLGWFGIAGARRLLATNPRRVGGAVGVVLAAVGLNRLWAFIYGPEVPTGFGDVTATIPAAFRRLDGVTDHLVGVYGYLNLVMEPSSYMAWQVLALGLVVAALVVGGWRERGLLVATILGAIAVPVLLEASVLRHTGFHIQGRHILPVVMSVPLLSGEILMRHRQTLTRWRADLFAVPVAVTAAVIQLLGWHTAVSAAAVGRPSRWLFFLNPAWTPPAGWLPWLLLALAGGGLLVLAALTASAPGLLDRLGRRPDPTAQESPARHTSA